MVISSYIFKQTQCLLHLLKSKKKNFIHLDSHDKCLTKNKIGIKHELPPINLCKFQTADTIWKGTSFIVSAHPKRLFTHDITLGPLFSPIHAAFMGSLPRQTEKKWARKHRESAWYINRAG